MKKIILISIWLMHCFFIYAQTGVSASYDFMKHEYGVNLRQGKIITCVKNGAYKAPDERVDIFEVGLGYAHKLNNNNRLFIIPTYNVYYNKSDNFIFFNDKKFYKLSLELGTEVVINKHLLFNIFFDIITREARVGIGWEF